MTRPALSALVLDGNQIKLRLMAERVATKSVVHIDWLRFTVRRRNVPAPSIQQLFPCPNLHPDTYDSVKLGEIDRALSLVPDCDHDAHSQALDLASVVAAELGDEFTACAEIRKGHDFYKHRLSIERAGAEVGWVGFGASSDSPRQRAQAQTLHVNLYGQACTFAASGWAARLADVVDERKGDITRCDLALDFFDGYPGGITRVADEWEAGLLDVNGKRPKHNCLGPWRSPTGRGRSFYVGSKEAGKQTNAYEKGDQLFGEEAGSDWLRFELRYGNKLRVLSTDMLRRPADFFAGASDWHAALIREADAVAVPEPVKCTARLPLETVKAECARVLRWAHNTAGATLGFLFRTLPDDAFLDLVGTTKLPGRLRAFKAGETVTALQELLTDFTPGRAGHAFA